MSEPQEAEPQQSRQEIDPQLAGLEKFGPQEWTEAEKLEPFKIPPPTIWPITVALGTTGIAFGVVTHWLLSIAGLFLFLIGAAGWIEDLRLDVQ